MVVEKRAIEGCDYAIILVAPADAPPVRYKGRVYIRTGPRKAIASAQDERILNERRRFRDLPFDLQPMATASLSDLERTLFENEYLPAAFAPDIVAANERSYEARLAALRLIESVESAMPTLLGVLVLCARPRDLVPGAYIQFLRIAGAELSEPIVDEDPIDGPIAECVRRIDEKLKAHIRTAVDLTSGSVERRTPDFPLVALEQVVRNAVMHRTYESTNAPVRVTWFDDRIEVQSPGGPFGSVNAQNFGTPGVTDYRNPNLAEAMKTLGLVQRFGVGIATAQKAMAQNGNPPIQWDVNDRFVLAILPRRS
jgi:ATP-dependent DNA helicase RecG